MSQLEKLKTEYPKNFIRRTIGIIVCFSPIVLLVFSLINSFIDLEQRPFAAVGFMIAGLFFAIINFYLSFIRPRRLLRRHGSLEGISNISGIPLIGTILVIFGGAFGVGAIGTALLGLLVLALDTGGAPWFLISTWRDSSFWDSSR